MILNIAILKFTVFALGLVIVGLSVKPVFFTWYELHSGPGFTLQKAKTELFQAGSDALERLVFMKGSQAPWKMKRIRKGAEIGPRNRLSCRRHGSWVQSWKVAIA